MNPEHGLGQLVAADERDRAYPLQALLSADTSAVRDRFWPYPKVRLDQGKAPICVEMSIRHRLAAGPVMQHLALPLGELYRRAQLIDEWPGEAYAGTSVRAGLKVGMELSYFTAYHWATDMPTARSFVCHDGPVLLGTVWTEAMMRPDREGYIRPDGRTIGGHAYLAIGYSVRRHAFRILNSWKGWGQNQAGWLHEDALAELLAEDGECAAPVERRVGP